MPTEKAAHLEISWTIIVNPQAGNGLAGKRWTTCYEEIKKILPHHNVQFTSKGNEANLLAKQAIENGSRGIMAVGGDGTNHEVVNGIMTQKEVPVSEIFYTLLPVGTGNDWIKTHDIPKEFSAWMEVFKKGHCRWQNIGQLHYMNDGKPAQRYFVNVAGLAYDGFVGVETLNKKPIFAAQIYYLLLVFICIFRYSPQRGRITYDGKLAAQRFYTINIGLCRYSAGGMRLVPQADPEGKAFGLTYAGALSKLGVILNTHRFYNGRIGNHPKVETTHARAIEIVADGDGPLLLEADGEVLGETPVKVEFLERALKFIAPAK